MIIFIKDVNKTAVCQGYNVVKKRENKKDKNEELRRIYLRYSKKGSYKKQKICIKYGTYKRKKQHTDCLWKAYAIWKNLAWTIQIDDLEYNHLFLASKAFASNCKFCQANINIIKNDAWANISPIKTLACFYNFNLGKYFTIRDLHNARV